MGLLQDKLAKYDLPQQIMAKGVYPYFRCIESGQNTEVMMSGHKVLMFGSNSYLGLTNHPKVIEAAVEATRKYGTGCAGSRFLNGTLDLHLALEKELAEFVGKEEAIIYSTGFQVNLGVVSCVTGRNDYILCDELDHASIVEGRRLSFSTAAKFKHNDMEDLERELQKCNPDSVKLIVVDGVFSMEGDMANLPEIVRLKKKYNASIMVDEAHGLGVLGRQGRGTCDHFGVTEDVDLIMGTFSKSLAAIGGFIASDASVINYLRHNSRSYIFSASNTPAATAAARAALHIMKTEPERIQHLWDVTNYALTSFRQLGFEIGNTSTPIIPLYVRDMDKTFQVTTMLFEEGVFVNPVVPPACSPNDTLIRFSLMATHTKEQVDIAIEKLVKCFKALDIPLNPEK
ncbi:putative 8-amino-7-oxononanoate synthase [Bacteroides sp. CAG:462]|nr:putative 8-amino-7-oxononanoate synthase [Bacteroides sp. CAG:462]